MSPGVFWNTTRPLLEMRYTDLARYSDNREASQEMKNLYKTWSKVDSRIKLPPTLTGGALLPLLDNLPEVKAPVREERRRIQFSPHVFSWKSVSTYAAALVLIVALSALLSRGPADIGTDTIEPAAGGQPHDTFENNNPLSPDSDPDTTVDGGSGEDSGTGGGDMLAVDAQTGGEQPAEGDAGEANAGDAEAQSWLGGPESILLYEDDAYTYTWLQNDPNDPDKAGFPLTVNILEKAAGGLAFSINVSGIESVDSSFVYGGKLSLLGPAVAEEDAVTLLVYDLTQPGSASCVQELTVPGALLNARLYKNYIDVVTYVPAGIDPGCDITALPDSTGDNLCVIAAVDLDTLQVEQKAFAGASETVSLYNLNAYLDYEGEPTDDNPEGHHIAHIRLDGLDIELRSED